MEAIARKLPLDNSVIYFDFLYVFLFSVEIVEDLKDKSTLSKSARKPKTSGKSKAYFILLYFLICVLSLFPHTFHTAKILFRVSH